MSLEAARDEILRCAGSHFDPAVVAVFAEIPIAVFAEIRSRSLNDHSAVDAAGKVVPAPLTSDSEVPASLTPVVRH